MKWTQHHFVAIDAALAKGLTVSVRGIPVTFAPLALDDLASIVANTRALGLDIWRQHELARGVKQEEYRLHTMELNTILFGAMPQTVLDYMSNPLIRKLIIALSIRRGLPDDRKSEAEAIALAVLDCSDEEAAQFIEIVSAMTVGPGSDPKGNDGNADPTSPSPSGESSDGA